MPSFAMLSLLIHRIGARGAVDNVSDVLIARAEMDAQVAMLEFRLAPSTPAIPAAAA